MPAPLGVLLMTFGSARSAAEVPAYLRSVRHGNDPDPALVAEFQRRYEIVGWSPLIEITLEQGAALQRVLDRERGATSTVVRVGMLHSEPTIEQAVREFAAARVKRVLGIVLAPQFSPIIMGGYERALRTAAQPHLPGAEVRLAGPWHTMPSFIEDLAARVDRAVSQLDHPERVAILFTTHSLPRPVVDEDPAYLGQIRQTIDLVVQRAGLRRDRWQFAYQSAGHTPEEWLTPDLKDLLPGIKSRGQADVLVVPVQFLADHLEILYDIDVAAREEAEAAGLHFHRVDLPNTSPRFIQALAEVVERESPTLERTPARP